MGREVRELVDYCREEMRGTESEKELRKDNTKLKQRVDELEGLYKSELQIRRSLHNKLQELRGNIRVVCRVRPITSGDHHKQIR